MLAVVDPRPCAARAVAPGCWGPDGLRLGGAGFLAAPDRGGGAAPRRGAGARTERLVNPVAWYKGMVMAKCGGCEEWHKLRDEANLVDVRAPAPAPFQSSHRQGRPASARPPARRAVCTSMCCCLFCCFSCGCGASDLLPAALWP